MTQSARANGGTRLWSKIRLRILIRDGYCCQYCGSEDATTVDHVVPISKGGTDDPDNLVAACTRCNYSKGNRMGQFFGQPRTPLTLPFPLSQVNESTSHD
ncbi:MAG: HNH endonuclease [Streptomycetaceae bacterium]|nr:MAG: HNH endonuclease [Streptomycetaceae bacterium]